MLKTRFAGLTDRHRGSTSATHNVGSSISNGDTRAAGSKPDGDVIQSGTNSGGSIAAASTGTSPATQSSGGAAL